jgi:2,3-bisphosphoglycerate-independent phosphoglycerate mutase
MTVLLNIRKAEAQVPVILVTKETDIRRILVQSQPEQIVRETRSQKNPTQKRPNRMAQMIKYLPSRHETLSSNPVLPKKKKGKKKKAETINKV